MSQRLTTKWHYATLIGLALMVAFQFWVGSPAYAIAIMVLAWLILAIIGPQRSPPKTPIEEKPGDRL